MPHTRLWRTRGFIGAVVILLFSGVLPRCADAQDLRVRVLDNETDHPIPDVLLELIGIGGEVVLAGMADQEGSFLFEDLPPGHYRLRGEQLGYQMTVSGFIALEPGDEVELDFRMAVEAILLEPITVTASPRPWYEHTKAPALWEFFERREYLEPLGRGRFLDQEDLRPLAGMPVSVAIGTIPGMQAVGSDVSPSRFHILGRRGCDAQFFLNGMPVRLMAEASRADTADVDFIEGPKPLDFFVDDFVALSDVEAIEVYRGPSELPGEFHGFRGGGNCGAVVVWTKRAPERIGRD